MLDALGDILREARRSRSVNIRQRNIIVLESRPPQPQLDNRARARANAGEIDT